MVRPDAKKILVINQYYWPDRASTGQLLTELCEDLSLNFEVTALVGTPSYSAGDTRKIPSRSVINNVEVLRVFNTSFGRKNMLGRLANYLSFMIFALIKALLTARHDIVVVMSDPPTVNFIGFCIKKLKGSKLIQICQDIYPELAVRLRSADNPILLSLFSMLNRISQKNADRIVAISDGMQRRLIAKGIRNEAITVIENWIDTDIVSPQPKRNSFSERFGLNDKFVVMHSGNIGLSQNLDLFLKAAEILKDRRDIIFVVVGDGAEKSNLVKLKNDRGLSNVLFIDYQDKKDLKYSLCSADIHFLSLKSGLSGLIVPSKIYGIMAAARPVIAVIEKDSDVARLISEFNCGTILENATPHDLAKGILDFYANHSLLDEMGKRAREAVVKRNSRKIISARYLDLLSNL